MQPLYDDLFSLKDKVALVAGGAGGIGRAIVNGLSNYGAHVSIADIAGEQASEVSKGVVEKGRQSLSLNVDITQMDSVMYMVSETIQHFGSIDVFVNCVGANVFAEAFNLSEADWDEVLKVNLTGAFISSRLVAKSMKERTGGSIINFVSVTALRGSPGQSAYAAAKAALINLTKTLALEWVKYSIRVNAISPVMTETPINTEWLNSDPERKAAITQRIPAGRLGNPDDFVGPVIFLASNASRFVLGQTMFVDGGASVSHPLFGGE